MFTQFTKFKELLQHQQKALEDRLDSQDKVMGNLRRKADDMDDDGNDSIREPYDRDGGRGRRRPPRVRERDRGRDDDRDQDERDDRKRRDDVRWDSILNDEDSLWTYKPEKGRDRGGEGMKGGARQFEDSLDLSLANVSLMGRDVTMSPSALSTRRNHMQKAMAMSQSLHGQALDSFNESLLDDDYDSTRNNPMDQSLPHNSIMIALSKTEGGSGFDISQSAKGVKPYKGMFGTLESSLRAAGPRNSDLRHFDAADLEPSMLVSISEAGQEEVKRVLEGHIERTAKAAQPLPTPLAERAINDQARLLQVDGLYADLNSNLARDGVPFRENTASPSLSRAGFETDTATFDIQELEVRNQFKLQQLQGALNELDHSSENPLDQSSVKPTAPSPEPSYGEELSVQADLSRMTTVQEGNEESSQHEASVTRASVSKLDDEGARMKILNQLGIDEDEPIEEGEEPVAEPSEDAEW
jgi:hypothetical protein